LFHKFLNLLFSLGESLGGLGEEVQFSQEFMKHFASQFLGESWARLAGSPNGRELAGEQTKINHSDILSECDVICADSVEFGV
jgi:hypothetical protein